MKKNNSLGNNLTEKVPIKHFLLIMRTIFILLFTCIFCSMAEVGYTQNARVTINKRNVTLKEVLNEIESQTDYLFIYNEKVNANEKVSVKSKQQAVANVLNALLKGKEVVYSMEGNHIILSAIEKASQPEKETAIAITQQQKKTITGTVVNVEGEPIVGANIIETGTTNGTVTDVDGKFSLNVENNATIHVSYIGYLAQVISTTGKISFNVTLIEDTQALEELIVVGYTITSKRSLVSSIAQVDTKDFATLPASNITQTLAGRAPGLIIESGSGLNAKASISIRGGGEPIYVIDGVIRSANDFANLNSEDIESMSILKDASSTAVYGARAAYGIVQITTKRGLTGKPKIDYSLNQTWGQPSFWANRVSSYDFAVKVNEALTNEGLDPQYSNEVLEKYRTGSDPGEYPNTDWRAAILRNWAPATKHNFSMTGGTELNNYYMSLGYADMNSLFKSGRYEDNRINYNLSNTTRIKEIGLSATAQISGHIESSDDVYTSEGSGNQYIIWNVGMKAPYEIAYNKYGLPYDVANNPAADASQDAGYMKSRATVINGLLNLEWALPWVDGLSLKALGNYNYYDRNDKNWRKDAAKYGWDSTTPLYAANPQLSLADTQGLKWTLQYIANYSKTFGVHTISALAGYEASYQKEKSMGLSRKNYALSIDQIGFGPTDGMDNSAWEAENGRAGYIAQLKYGLLNRYYLEGAYRRDGSDIFPKDKRWGNFFSFSAGWTLSDERFMQPLRDRHILDLMKLRASYGEVGMDQGIGRFLYMDMYDYNATGYVYDGKMFPSLSEGAVPSVNLTWYKDKQYGIGFDFASLNNRLYGMSDYYLFATTGYMADPDPKLAGYIAPYGRGLPQIESDGEKRRAGFDLQLGYRDTYKDFKYDIGFNFTKYDIYWANYPWESLDVKMNPYKRQTGQYEHFSQVGYHYIKTANSAQEWMQYAQRQGSTNLTGGDFIYEDFNGDGRLTGDDQYQIGNSVKPRINYGITADFQYKGFTLNMLFQGAGQRDLPISRVFWNYNYLTRYDYQLDYWTQDNQNAKFPRLVSNQAVNGNNNLMPSEAWTFNGKYFRMKSLIFSYDFKYSLLKNINWLTTCRLAFTGQNLFTISDATKYSIDPEVRDISSSYPIERVIGFSLNLGF